MNEYTLTPSSISKHRCLDYHYKFRIFILPFVVLSYVRSRVNDDAMTTCSCVAEA